MQYAVLIFITLITYGNSAKILGVFPVPSKSHHIIASALLKELAARGHEVTMISPFPLKNPPERYEDVNMGGLLDKKDEIMKMALMTNQSLYDTIMTIYNNVPFLVYGALNNTDLHDFLKEGRKYDLVIQLMLFMNEAFLGIGHAVNATTIGFCTAGSSPMTNYFTGNPAPFAYVPSMLGRLSDEMTFLQRVMNTVINIIYDLSNYFILLPYQEKLVKEIFPESPPIRELIKDVDLMLINSHIATETPRPYLPNMIQIGGFHLEEKQTIPRDMEQFLNSSKHGVIFFSLGSNVKSSQLPMETQAEILGAFSEIEYDVLWTFDGILKNKPRNVMTTEWAPQRAILGHPKVKAFITHGGHGSTVEAIYFAKPMICIPLFADQYKNTAESVAKGYAIELPKDEITKKSLVSSINEILDNPSYRDKIELKSDIYRNQEVNPMDKAVFWVEHVLKHKGAKHLKAMAAHLHWYQYLLLDVIAFISIVLMLGIGAMNYSFKLLYRLCCGKMKKIKTN